MTIKRVKVHTDTLAKLGLKFTGGTPAWIEMDGEVVDATLLPEKPCNFCILGRAHIDCPHNFQDMSADPVAEGECCEKCGRWNERTKLWEPHNPAFACTCICHTPKEVSDSDLDKATEILRFSMHRDALPPTEEIEELPDPHPARTVPEALSSLGDKLNELIKAHNRRIKQ
jgi:hypothetical protein